MTDADPDVARLAARLALFSVAARTWLADLLDSRPLPKGPPAVTDTPDPLCPAALRAHPDHTAGVDSARDEIADGTALPDVDARARAEQALADAQLARSESRDDTGAFVAEAAFWAGYAATVDPGGAP